MKKHGLALVLLTLVIRLGAAQTGSRDEKAFYLHSLFGANAPALGGLNDGLEAGGHLALRPVYFSRGAGFYTVFPKSRLASLFTFSSFSGTRREDGRSNWLRGTSAGTALGIAVLNNRVQLVPYGGLVYTWFGVRVASNAPGSSAFNGYLSGPPNQHHITSNRFMVNLGLHLARTRFAGSGLGEKLVLGLRGGYYLPLGETRWKTENVPLENGPGSSAGGPYVQVLIGFRQ